jgi:hypothetical protein
MKTALVTFAVFATTVAILAVAQDGGGHGPPPSPIIVLPTLPTPTTTTPSVPKLSQPGLR